MENFIFFAEDIEWILSASQYFTSCNNNNSKGDSRKKLIIKNGVYRKTEYQRYLKSVTYTGP